MLFVILAVSATVCAKPWHTIWTMTRPPAVWHSSPVPPSDYPTLEFLGRFHSHEEGRHHPHSEGDRYRWCPEEGRHRHSYEEEGRHSYHERDRYPPYHEEDRYHPYHEEDRYRQQAKKQICSGDFLKKYDGVGPYARYHRILSVTVEFETGNRTVSCTNSGRYHHRY